MVSPSEDKPIDILHPNRSFVGLHEDSSFHVPANGSECISDLAPPEVDDHFIDIQLEDVLPESDDDNDDAVFNKSRMWLNVDGKPVHKSSAVSSLLGLGNLLKSKDCLRKVRGYSLVPVTATLDDDLLIGSTFIIGNIVACFLQIDNCAALAVVRITGITNPSGTNVPSMGKNSLSNAKVILTGQVIQLKHTNQSWIWTGDWEIFKKVATSKSAESIHVASKHTTLPSFPVTLVQCLSPDLVPHASSITWCNRFLG